MVCSAVKDDPVLLAIAVPALVQALLRGRGWHIDGLIRSSVEMVKGPTPEVVDKLVTHHAKGSKKRALIVSLGKSSLEVDS
jgi:hypothetical protein